MYTTGVNTPMLNIYSYRDSPREKKLYSLTILTEPDLWFSMEPPSGKSTSMKGKGSTRNTGLFVALLRLAYQGAFPDKPENTVEKMIPSEDVRLVDREHHTVAVLGLSEAGEPNHRRNQTRWATCCDLCHHRGWFRHRSSKGVADAPSIRQSWNAPRNGGSRTGTGAKRIDFRKG